MAEDCGIDVDLRPDGLFTARVFGHLLPWDAAKVALLNAQLQMMIDTAPDGVQMFEIVVPANIIVHVSPDDARDLVNKIGGMMAYLGAKKMKEEHEGFEP